jgi:hypothetical protein
MASRTFHALFLGAAVLVGWPPSVTSVLAQDATRYTATGSTYPSGFEVAFEWRYSCPDGRGCSFNCPGSGGANNVTKLSMRWGSIPTGKTERAAGIFYEFSTMQIPRGNGFVLTTGISTLACQVQGMNLDYSGPTDTPTGSIAKSK